MLPKARAASVAATAGSRPAASRPTKSATITSSTATTFLAGAFGALAPATLAGYDRIENRASQRLVRDPREAARTSGPLERVGHPKQPRRLKPGTSQDPLLAKYLVGHPLVGHLPVRQDRDLVRGAREHLHVVRDERDPHALLRQRAHEVDELLDTCCVEPGRRLVEEQVGRLEREDAGNRDRTLLPARALERAALQGPVEVEAHRPERARDPVEDLVVGKAQVVGAERDVVEDRAREELPLGALPHEPHARMPLPPAHGRALAQAVHGDAAIVAALEPGEAAQQGGLA